MAIAALTISVIALGLAAVAVIGHGEASDQIHAFGARFSGHSHQGKIDDQS